MSKARPPSAIYELVLARWRSTYREPGVLFWSFGFPLVLAIALGIAFRDRPPRPVVVAIESGEGSDVVMKELEGAPDVTAKVLDETAANEALRTGKVDIVLTPGAPRSYRFDPTRPDSRLAREIVDDRLQRAEGREDHFAPVDRRVSEPGWRYIDFLIPGLIGTGLMQGGLWGVGYVIVDMRTRKLIKRFLATPMKKRDFLLAFVVARALFLIVELPILLTFAALVFKVPVHGNLAILLGVATLGSISFAGIGLLVASRAENIQTAGGLVNLASLPMFMVSGTFFPASRFPEVVQPVIRVLPLTALNDALRRVMLDGSGVAGISTELAILAAWGIVSFGLALRFFRWR